MPELPEIEAWVRELDPLVSQSLRRARRPGAHRHPEDVRSAARRARGADVLGLAAPRQEPALPDGGRRARPSRAPDERRAAALPRCRSENAEDADVPALLRRRRRAVLTEAGKKHRAGVWLFTPEGLDAELAHLGPGRARARADRLGEYCAASAASSIRSCATSARSRASAAHTRTRSSGSPSSRRSSSPPISRPR